MGSRQAIKRIIIIALLVKVAYFIVAFVIANYTESNFKERNEFRAESPKPKNLIRIFYRHDANWYANIARFGHQKITPQELPTDANPWYQSPYAFFPAYPYSIRAFLAATGNFSKDYFIVVGFIYSIMLSLGCFICFYYFSNDYFQNAEKAFTATLLLIIFPFHYYFSMCYTESLFLLLTIGCFLAINKDNYWLLYLLAAILVLTRPNGITASIPLALWYFKKENWQLTRQNIIRMAILFSVMGFTLLGYCIYMKYMTGDYFAFSTAQRGWGRFRSNPFKTLWDVENTKDRLLSAYTILFMLITLVSIRKFNLGFLALILIGLFLPISNGIVMSMPRFISVLFPFTLLFVGYVHPLSRFKQNLTYLLLFSLHIVTFITWLYAEPFSF